jgi:tape measure domain-containing protein
MSQVVQAGVAYTEDLNILQDRGVPIYKAIADQLGVDVGSS